MITALVLLTVAAILGCIGTVVVGGHDRDNRRYPGLYGYRPFKRPRNHQERLHNIEIGYRNSHRELRDKMNTIPSLIREYEREGNVTSVAMLQATVADLQRREELLTENYYRSKKELQDEIREKQFKELVS